MDPRFNLIVVCAIVGMAQPAQAQASRRRDAVVEVVQRVSPAVVYVGTEQFVERRFRSAPHPFFDQFFDFGQGQPERTEGLGSGVILSADGLVVTNDHVIRGASAIHVILADGRRLDAEVLGSDADNDLAVLRVPARSPLPYASLGRSGDLMIGERAIAIGSPFGLKKSVTVGVVSAVGRTFKADGRVYNDFVQTDASINPGNSGGPLLNADGEIIGINTAIFASAQGIGFAIPADKVRRIVAELTQFGKVRPSWVGAQVQSLTPELGRQLGWDRVGGVLVVGVDAESPAQKAGIARGDIISEVGGAPVEDAEDFNVRLKGYPARSNLSLKVFRRGAEREIQVTATEFPPRLVASLAWDRLGIRVKETRRGLAISQVRAGSVAAEVGLAPGDVILRINNQPLDSADAFRDHLLTARAQHSVLLLVLRGRMGYHLTLPF